MTMKNFNTGQSFYRLLVYFCLLFPQDWIQIVCFGRNLTGLCILCPFHRGHMILICPITDGQDLVSQSRWYLLGFSCIKFSFLIHGDFWKIPGEYKPIPLAHFICPTSFSITGFCYSNFYFNSYQMVVFKFYLHLLIDFLL
jgi:hypothetical protein